MTAALSIVYNVAMQNTPKITLKKRYSRLWGNTYEIWVDGHVAPLGKVWRRADNFWAGQGHSGWEGTDRTRANLVHRLIGVEGGGRV